MAKKNEETVEETKAQESQEAAEEKTETGKEVKNEKPEEIEKPKTAKSDSNESDDDSGKKRNRRAEKIGVVYSDKMTNTVVVRVDRIVKHQLYQKYMKKRKKFMAHDELGAGMGDRVRIVETRPLSAKKRWRVVEIIQKAQK